MIAEPREARSLLALPLISAEHPALISVHYSAERPRVWRALRFDSLDALAEIIEMLARGPTRVRGEFPSSFVRGVALGGGAADVRGSLLVAIHAHEDERGTSMLEASKRLDAAGVAHVAWSTSADGRSFVIACSRVAPDQLALLSAGVDLADLAGLNGLVDITGRARPLPLPAPAARVAPIHFHAGEGEARQ